MFINRKQSKQVDPQSQIAQVVSQANHNTQINQVATTTANGKSRRIRLSFRMAIISCFVYFRVCVVLVPTTMENSMGQIVPMTSMALSQSMDSVNTATNEEEVSAFQSILFVCCCFFILFEKHHWLGILTSTNKYAFEKMAKKGSFFTALGQYGQRTKVLQ